MATKHGYSKTITYSSWKHMRQRCLNPKDADFHHYGGKGIAICSEWDDFENFLMDMGEKPHGLVLDRKEVLGNYCKENCRWVPKGTSSFNRVFKTKKSTLPRGVYYENNGYRSNISIENVQYYIGHYDSIEEAKKAYDDVCLEWYGQSIN